MEHEAPRTEPGGGYERRDARIAPILIGAAALAAAGVITFLVCLWLFDAFEVGAARLDISGAEIEEARSRKLPPAPRLQVEPERDLADMREEERALLEGYGWVDEKAGIVRIPIERAMDLVVERDLAAREER